MRKINLLAVARWPLGGIRTYMKYVYKHLSGRCAITILAASTLEDKALIRDAEAVGATLILHRPEEEEGKGELFAKVFRELRKKKYDLVQSHGFISSVHVYLANLLLRVPHVLTVHGILEERYLKGRMSRLKKSMLAKVIGSADAVCAVSDDIMKHLMERIPSLEYSKGMRVVIKNGIDIELFDGTELPKGLFRKGMRFADDLFLAGFLGRFMPEKGFNCLIDAVGILEERAVRKDFKILAVGSGAYLDWYREMIRKKGLEGRFAFMPFQERVSAIYRDLDVLVMPSLWEAFPLQPMEALCSGTPLIASDCMGLRETVRETPAVVFASGDPAALAEAMQGMMEAPRRKRFEEFMPFARERFDARKTAERLYELFQKVLARGGG